MAVPFGTTQLQLHGLLSILVATLFIWFAARLVLNRSSVLAALASAVISTLLAALIVAYVDGVLGIVLAIVVWALFTALFFRTDWAKGAIIGLVAWVLSFLVGLLLEKLE
ncbi:MAG TPA: hypothetical protein VHI93_04090 [Candidatus Thermoplasmatota archaeon]|nr:hypothetical protein [Candidatus Thermoplasmatota archaeon]